MNLMIVDMLEGFTRNGALSSPRVEALIPLQVKFIEQMPKDSFIVLACDSHQEGDSELKRTPKHCMRGTDEANVCPEILNAIKARGTPYEIVIKRTHSAFFHTSLDAIINARSEGDDWVIFGCVTDICIVANLIELDYRGKNVTIVRDLVDTYDVSQETVLSAGLPQAVLHTPEMYNPLFFEYYFPGVWGATVAFSDDVLRDAGVIFCDASMADAVEEGVKDVLNGRTETWDI